jgi:hypothetical protein
VDTVTRSGLALADGISLRTGLIEMQRRSVSAGLWRRGLVDARNPWEVWDVGWSCSGASSRLAAGEAVRRPAP